ncbi:hypothetical protein J1N35_018260 [Gossypium stocksii]|uniref:Uncharacterized protein n=1 Tax=Gossypium stocksii TaxID=47602 RepID=A0A9D3VQC6_9ROSI|nr:hypothetical protein J1N35_018260 [Gossypium stocksii]
MWLQWLASLSERGVLTVHCSVAFVPANVLDEPAIVIEVKDGKEGSRNDRHDWEGAVKLSLRGLMVYIRQSKHEFSIDCNIYQVVVNNGLSVVVAPLPSAMEVTTLGHGSSGSSIDPVQVSMLLSSSLPFIYTPAFCSTAITERCGNYHLS